MSTKCLRSSVKQKLFNTENRTITRNFVKNNYKRFQLTAALRNKSLPNYEQKFLKRNSFSWWYSALAEYSSESSASLKALGSLEFCGALYSKIFAWIRYVLIASHRYGLEFWQKNFTNCCSRWFQVCEARFLVTQLGKRDMDSINLLLFVHLYLFKPVFCFQAVLALSQCKNGSFSVLI